jgi:hypothetical protein
MGRLVEKPEIVSPNVSGVVRCCVEWRKSACGTGMPKMSEVDVMKAWLLSSWKD